MILTLIGLNHKTAPIEIRERFYLQPLERELFLSELKSNPKVIEALVLSTCNRTEIYAYLVDYEPDVLWELFFKIKNLSIDPQLKKHFFTHSDVTAVKHLFRVAAGLDSLILGEKQILGQLKEAIELSRRQGMMARHLNILSNTAIRAGKKARTETLIDYGGTSISWAAVNMAQAQLETLDGKSVLIIGAGKMGKLAVRHLKEKGAGPIYVANRTHQTAESLVQEMGGVPVSFWDIKDILAKVDVCICSASAPHYLIESDLVEEVMVSRRDRRLICIDISMPRNINPAIAAVKNVSLIAIDELDKVLEDTINRRLEAALEVERIVDKKVEEFFLKLNKRPESLMDPRLRGNDENNNVIPAKAGIQS